MLTSHLNLILLIAGILVAVVTLLCRNEIGRWGRFIGTILAVVWLLSVNYHRL